MTATELLVLSGLLFAVAAVAAYKLKWGDHVQREERRYRSTRRFAAMWALILMTAVIVLFPLGVIGVVAGRAGGWICLLIATLLVVGSRFHFWVARRRRPRWLEIALDKRQRDK